MNIMLWWRLFSLRSRAFWLKYPSPRRVPNFRRGYHFTRARQLLFLVYGLLFFILSCVGYGLGDSYEYSWFILNLIGSGVFSILVIFVRHGNIYRWGGFALSCFLMAVSSWHIIVPMWSLWLYGIDSGALVVIMGSMIFLSWALAVILSCFWFSLFGRK